MRLIDADALKLEFKAVSELDHYEPCQIKRILNEIDQVPTVERPHGEWKKEGDIFYHVKCSNCNFELKSPYDKSNFCPNCGADMREGEAE